MFDDQWVAGLEQLFQAWDVYPNISSYLINLFL